MTVCSSQNIFGINHSSTTQIVSLPFHYIAQQSHIWKFSQFSFGFETCSFCGVIQCDKNQFLTASYALLAVLGIAFLSGRCQPFWKICCISELFLQNLKYFVKHGLDKHGLMPIPSAGSKFLTAFNIF